MILQGTLHSKAVVGVEGSFTTKAGLKRAWEKKQKEELKAENEAYEAAMKAAEEAKLAKLGGDFRDMFIPAVEVDAKPRKELPESVRDLIAATQKKIRRDEFECLVDPSVITTSTFCCLNHYNECVKTRDNHEDMSLMLLEADIQVAADRVDYHNTTFVCRYQLKLILLRFLKKYRIPVVDDRVEELLDGCVMNHEDQVRLREWADPEKRSNPLFDIPLSGYSTSRFASLISKEINSFQQKKKFVSDE
jgi:hypothetical protein